MKRLLATLVGAFALLGFGIVIVLALSDWINATFIRSDDDMNTELKILLLGVYPALLIIGGWLGSALFQKHKQAKKR